MTKTFALFCVLSLVALCMLGVEAVEESKDIDIPALADEKDVTTDQEDIEKTANEDVSNDEEELTNDEEEVTNDEEEINNDEEVSNDMEKEEEQDEGSDTGDINEAEQEKRRKIPQKCIKWRSGRKWCIGCLCKKVCTRKYCYRRICKPYRCYKKVCRNVHRYKFVPKFGKKLVVVKVCKKIPSICHKCWNHRYVCGVSCRNVCQHKKCSFRG